MLTLVIANPHAGGGLVGRIWQRLRPVIEERLGEVSVAVTDTPEDAGARIREAADSGLSRVIAVGGDGTNNSVVRALVEVADERGLDRIPWEFGMIPIGTGRDWARTLRMPTGPDEVTDWLARAKPHICDVGILVSEGHSRPFLNVASAGIGGDVDARVNAVKNRRPWTFLRATLASLLQYRPQRLRVRLDGNLWYEGSAYIVAVANGRYFGHGMLIAPDAAVDDGLFDVVLVEGMPRHRIIGALPTVYRGTHLERDDVHHARASRIEIETEGGEPLGLDVDGEHAAGRSISCEIRPGFLPILLHPDALRGHGIEKGA